MPQTRRVSPVPANTGSATTTTAKGVRDPMISLCPANFFPRMGLTIMLTMTLWFVITRAIDIALNPDKYTSVEQLSLTFSGSLMSSLFLISVIGCCRREPSLVVAGLIGVGVAMFMSLNDIVATVTELVTSGGVYGSYQCRCPKYYNDFRQYCNAQTILRVLFNFTIHLLIITLFNAVYTYWKDLTKKKEETRKKWTASEIATMNARLNASYANAPLPGVAQPTFPTTGSWLIGDDGFEKIKLDDSYSI